MVARAVAWSRGMREVDGAGVESRSAANQDASARALGRRTIGARQEACRRARLQADTASSCRPGGEPAARQIPAWPDGDGPRALRRLALGHALAHAVCADFGDRESLPRSPRTWCAGCSRDHPDEKTISLLAISVSHLRSAGTCNWNSRLGSKMRSAVRALKEAWRVGWPTELLT